MEINVMSNDGNIDLSTSKKASNSTKISKRPLIQDTSINEEIKMKITEISNIG
jgi:hypothetical protein